MVIWMVVLRKLVRGRGCLCDVWWVVEVSGLVY